MSAVLRDGVIVLTGRMAALDAETLLALLLDRPGAAVDITAAETLHTAVWQVLMALSPPILGGIDDEFATNWLVPRILAGEGSKGEWGELAIPGADA